MSYNDQGHWRGYHDIGGLPAEKIEKEERPLQAWERRVHAMVMLLIDAKRHIIKVDEYRRGVESLGADVYAKESYYARWLGSITNLLVEKGILTTDEIAHKQAEIAAREKHSNPT